MLDSFFKGSYSIGLIADLAGLVVFLPLYLLRVPREEQMMLEHFGQEYRLYMSGTGRVIPRFQK